MSKADPRPPQKSSAANKPSGIVPSATRPAASDPPAAMHRSVTKPARMPKGSTAPSRAPLTSRTKTLDDPLTTSLLAEITRRPRTVDVSPEQIAEARARALDDRDPDEST
ncbi:MAG TPA: hypothetical protein VK607_10355 [Kofleriaceae bacterium]|nr:hypothetical protein [Kofleriaceae bacterium]HMG51854.1 hypothetical protein [Kofleriaceae bacterium]